MAGNHNRCLELVTDIQTIDSRTWLMRISIAQQAGQDANSERWYTDGLERLADTDWEMEINRFHLSDPEMKTSLTQLAASLA